MTEVSVYEAKTRLSALLEQVASGEEVVITKRNKPVARIVPMVTAAAKPVRGSARKAMRASGRSWDEITEALAPMNDEALEEWGIR